MRRVSSKTAKQFFAYNIGGLAFFVVGYGVFALGYGLFGWPWWLAKLIGDAIGWAVNYVIQRYGVFREAVSGQRERAILAKFSLVSGINVVLDFALVAALKFVGISPFIGLWLSSLFFTVLKYAQYRLYVFARLKD